MSGKDRMLLERQKSGIAEKGSGGGSGSSGAEVVEEPLGLFLRTPGTLL